MINLMDLKIQNNSLKEEFKCKIDQIFEKSQFILGNNVTEFELEIASYHNVKHAIGVGNGTDALVISLKACGIQPGDEVIVPAMSFFATSEAVVQVGAIPIFVDIDFQTYTIDNELIEKAISSKTKAIIPVHLYGNPADMNDLLKIAKKFNLKVIEDSCQAIGSEISGKKISSFGDASCISFFPTKNLGGIGDGGVILTNDDDIATYALALRVHGAGGNGKLTYEKLYNAEVNLEPKYLQFSNTKYNNSIIGYNSRLDEIQAAMLRIKLNHLDKWNNRRIEIANLYNDNIRNPLIIKPHCRDNTRHVYYVYTILVENREVFMEYMKQNDIATGVYFPIPLHKQYAHKSLVSYNYSFPNAERLAMQNVAIPIYPELTNQQVEYIIKIVNQYKGDNYE